MRITRERILKTLELFGSLLEKKGIRGLAREIPKHFLVFQASGFCQEGDVLFTGYYQPVLDAQSHQGAEYRYPLYRKPDDLQIIDLEQINPKFVGGKIALRVDKGVIKPYFDRKAIDEDLVLQGRGLELAYLKDFLDRYMLQVQGSGILLLEDGGTKNIHYVASNCYPYVSLGELLKEDGKISREGMSLGAIRRYYQKNPQQIKEYLYRNQRYIFFEEFAGALVGSEGVALTSGRSIATDKTLFPGGGLAFILCGPLSSGSGGRNPGKHGLYRFMVDQDTGSAMQGPGRVDIFWGTGKEAEKIAGSFKEKGKLYYLLIKES
jgi:membrane-bound lytic murein transglycosylase A